MNKYLKGAVAAVALAGGTIGAAMPAQARPWHGGYYHGYHGVGTGTAIAAGILGLGVGAAIASSDRGYDRGYYAPPPPPPPPVYGYGYAPGYYAPPPPPPAYYGGYGYRGW